MEQRDELQNITIPQDQADESSRIRLEPGCAKEERDKQFDLISKGDPAKKVKKSGKKRALKENPFDDLKVNFSEEDGLEGGKQSVESKEGSQRQWIKPKTTPLTIDVVDFSKINRFYSHKSLQKYIRYLFAKTCPNPMWLSIKRQSQVERIIFIDFEIENSIFHNLLQDESDPTLNFFKQFNVPSKKAIFKETAFLNDTRSLWDSLFIYDQVAMRNENKACFEGRNAVEELQNLSKNITEQIYEIYETYTLSHQTMKNNLYPLPELPVYKDYFAFPKSDEKRELTDDSILIIDCEMVMSARGFELARTSIMNFSGKLIYDEFFKPEMQITNYNTQYSGITAQTLENVTKTTKDLHQDLSKLMNSQTILVGHSLENDLHAMKMIHHRVIDTSVLFQRKNGSKMKLKTLTSQLLKRSIQVGSHCSEEDCKATLQIMRYKIQLIKDKTLDEEGKIVDYHLLKQLIENKKNVAIIDSGDLEFIKHEKAYLGTHVEIASDPCVSSILGKHVMKYLGKDVCQADALFARVRSSGQEWERYYTELNTSVQQMFEKSPIKSVFLLNFQVNNNILIYPQDQETRSERRRPFCMIAVKAE